MLKRAQSILKETFGYHDFRPLQREIISNILERKDTLAIMPTGGGKSLCYQIPALIFEGLTVVVSPLISLMKDQVEQLIELGIDAAFLNSTLSLSEYQATVERIKNYQIRLLYVAPETLLMQRTLNLLDELQVDLFAIDEAHCISEWGHDFRPEYRQLTAARSKFPDAVCTAFTATATKRVQKDIKASLHFQTSNEFIASFNRKNLFLEIVSKADSVNQTIEFIKRFPGQSGIVYCTTRKQVDELYNYLNEDGFSAKPYHAGLTDQERKENQERFIRDDIQIMVATIAFGMGINKPNVRFVVHYDLPANIEQYYQQIGRAGRDGLNAHCLLLFSYGDIQRIQYFIDQKSGNEKKIAGLHLDAMVSFAESHLCRRVPLLTYFGEKYELSHCDMCDNCQSQHKEEKDVTVEAQKFLSCVKRSGERFGAGHITDILRGSESKKIKQFQHQYLPTHGIGKELSKDQWMYLSRQFIQQQLLKKDLQYGSLKLTEKGWQVLQGKIKVKAALEKEKITYSIKSGNLDHYDKPLYERLKTKRKELADKAGLPPYVIFHDRTLMEMAVYFPQSKESMFTIHGVGVMKYTRYGYDFLEIIKLYCKAHHIKEIKIRPDHLSQKTKIKKRRYIEVGEAYTHGETIESLRKKYGVTIQTIVKHLFTCFLDGYSLQINEDILEYATTSKAYHHDVFNAFDKFGTEILAPVFESMEQKVSYEDLQILRLYYLTKKLKKTTMTPS